MAGPFDELLQTIDTLRSPGGCPWDRKQSLHDAARYLMDEAGELVDATLAGDVRHVREELGDLLFMISFCTRILSETEPVTMHDVAREGNEKLVRRHPHVFGDRDAENVGESQERWNEIKRQEKIERGIDPDAESALKDMPAATAPLHQAYVYQKDAAEVGFDWPGVAGVWAKLREELAEVEAAGAEGDPVAVRHEIGDLLFAVVNLARWFQVQPDIALREANRRFRDRFHLVEADFRARDEKLEGAGLDALEESWQKAKRKLAGG